MITYGVVPRLIALMICLWRRHVALRWALVHTPGAAEVLDRLNSPSSKPQQQMPFPLYSSAPYTSP